MVIAIERRCGLQAPAEPTDQIIIIDSTRFLPYGHLNADATNMNAKYITIPTTPHLNHNLAGSIRSSKQNLMEFPNGNKTIALTPNMKFNPYIFCS